MINPEPECHFVTRIPRDIPKGLEKLLSVAGVSVFTGAVDQSDVGHGLKVRVTGSTG